jgi:iron-sulfur cluster repair protein YtfE (RIC family)
VCLEFRHWDREVPVHLLALLESVRTNLEAHMRKKEDVLFPAMRLAGTRGPGRR